MKKRQRTDFSLNLESLLRKNDMDILELEQALHYAEGSLKSNYFYGTRIPCDEIIIAIAKYFGVEPEYLTKRRIPLENEIEKVEQKFQETEFAEESDYNRCSDKLLSIVPDVKKEELIVHSIKETAVGKLLVTNPKSLKAIYVGMVVSGIIFLVHPLLSVKLVSGILMCLGGVLINYTIKNRKRIDKVTGAFIQMTLCVYSCVSLVALFVTM